jgi:hypothetical protein
MKNRIFGPYRAAIHRIPHFSSASRGARADNTLNPKR